MRRNFQFLDITQQLSTEQIQQRQDKLQNLYVVPTHKNTPNTVHLRDGEVVLYKRERSSVWQARFRLYDKKWHSVSTKHYNLEFASRAACEIYNEARFRERMGVSHTRRRFDTIAKATIKELEAEAEAGIKPMTNKDYIRVINKYFIPFFGHRYLEKLIHLFFEYFRVCINAH